MNSQAPNVDPERSTDVTAWYLVVEFSPKEFLSDRIRSDGLMARFLSLPRQELETLPEWLATLDAMLASFAIEVEGKFEQDGRVRVFCQRKIIDESDPGRPASQLDSAGERMAPAPPILDPGKKMNGGWGCYAIEKGRDCIGTGCSEPGHIIEIYVYRESIDTP